MRLSSILNAMREVMFKLTSIVDFEDFRGRGYCACAYGSFGMGGKTLSDAMFSLAFLICEPSTIA